MFQYFPSCNFTRMHPQASKWIIQYLRKQPDVKIQGCCNKTKYVVEDQAITVCQTCRGYIEGQGYKSISLWEYIDSHEDFPLPDYSGLEVSIQDCWRDKDHPEVQRAIRNILTKMNIKYHEVYSPYCANFHMESFDPALQAKIDALEDTHFDHIPKDVFTSLMDEVVSRHQGYMILTYCNRCTMGFNLVNANAKHLLQMIYEGNQK